MPVLKSSRGHHRFLREATNHKVRGGPQTLCIERSHSVGNKDEPHHHKKEAPAHCNERELPTDIATKGHLTITRKETTHRNERGTHQQTTTGKEQAHRSQR